LFDNISEINERHRQLVFSEFAKEHEEWFETYESLYRPHSKDAILKGRAVSEAEAEKAKKASETLRDYIEEVMEINGIDVWISPPALGPAPKGIHATGDPIMNLPWTNAGLPTVTLPVAKNKEGLPLGLQLSSSYKNDERLVDWTKTLAAALSENSVV
jgi:Asp-tRNA(Asn)/Glu-tRNA(Gln) amidotransferase A subunit family amidase